MPWMAPVFGWIGSLFSGAAFGGGVAGGLASAAAWGAVSAAAGASIKQNNEVKAQGNLLDLQINPSAPRRIVVGKHMVGGEFVDWFVSGEDNNRLYMVVYLSEGPCGNIKRVFGGGREVWAGDMAHGVRTAIDEYEDGGNGQTLLHITYFDGRTDQQASSTLSYFPGWSPNNKMTGCAYVLIEAKWTRGEMPSPPTLTFEMEGAKLYDRRKDTTAGGSGEHRLHDPNTWEYSNNPMVALDHYMLGRYWNEQRVMGIGLDPEEVPYERFAAQANVCDEHVEIEGGSTQERYRANGGIWANTNYGDVIKDLCKAMAARPADFGGRIGVIGSEPRAPVLAIDDGDLLEGIPEIFSPKRQWTDLVGAVEGRFKDPDNLYQDVDYPRVTEEAWALEDGGEPRVATFDLNFETNVERAQRLATLYARRERRQGTLQGTYPIWAIELEQGDWFIRTGDRWGDGKTFEVLTRIVDPKTLTVTITAFEVDAEDSAWSHHMARPGPVTPSISESTLGALATPVLAASPTSISGAQMSVPAISVGWTDVEDSRIDFIEVEYASEDRSFIRGLSLPADAGQTIISEGVLTGEVYQLRARYHAEGMLPGGWSNLTGVQIEDLPSIPWSVISGTPAELTELGDIDDQITELKRNIPTTFPFFTIVGGIGNLSVDGNVAAASSVQVSEGYFDHPLLGEIEVEETYFATPWDVLFAPANGWFAVIWSEELTETRFGNNAGNMHFFPATYKNGSWIAYKQKRKLGETFTPRPTDVVIAQCFKAENPDKPELSIVDGITHIENFIRDTGVVNVKLDEVSTQANNANSTATSALSAVSDEASARASAIQSVQASVGQAQSNASSALSAASDAESAVASLESSVNASIGQAQSNATSALNAASNAQNAVASLQQSVNASLEQANANANSALQSAANLDGAWAQFLTNIETNFDASEATAEETAQAFSGLQSAFAEFKEEVTATVADIEGSVTSVMTAYTDIDSTFASLQDNVNISIENIEGSVTSVLSAQADLANTLELAAGFQLDANGRISSFVLFDDGSTSQAAFLADAFRIYNGSTEQAVFTASNGVVKMPNVEIDKLKVGSVTYTSLASDAVRNGAKKISNSSMDMLPNKQWKSIWTLTHNKREADTEMYFTYKMRFDRPGNLSDVYFYRVQMELLRNGVVVDDDFNRIANTHPDSLNGRIPVEDLPAGSANWEVRVQVWEGSNNNGIPASTPVKLLKHRLELKEQK